MTNERNQMALASTKSEFENLLLSGFTSDMQARVVRLERMLNFASQASVVQIQDYIRHVDVKLMETAIALDPKFQ